MCEFNSDPQRCYYNGLLSIFSWNSFRRHKDKIELKKNEELSECVNLIVTLNCVIIMVSLLFSFEIA